MLVKCYNLDIFFPFSAVFNGGAVWLFKDWSCNPEHHNATHILQCVKPVNINRDSYNPKCSFLYLTCGQYIVLLVGNKLII